MTIPLINQCEFFAYHKETDHQSWLCLFTIENQPYHMYVGIRRSKWIRGTLFSGHDFKHQSGIEVTDISFNLCHLFEQLIQLLQFHSKDRLRLLTYGVREYGYGNEDFEPALSYTLPKKVKMNEKNLL